MISVQIKEYQLNVTYHEFHSAVPKHAWPQPSLYVFGESIGEAIVQGIVKIFGSEAGNYTAQEIEGTHNQYSIRKEGYRLATFHLYPIGSITVKDGKEK